LFPLGVAVTHGTLAICNKGRIMGGYLYFVKRDFCHFVGYFLSELWLFGGLRPR